MSGFHALISSGTTPKLLANEGHARYIGYGGMLMESFVAIMAMVAASVIEPGVYFAMNSPAAIVGGDVVTVAQTVSSWGFAITPEALQAVAKDIGETTILARAGGAPTLAVGIAQILHSVLPGENTMAFWYHFAILFEALFILTAVDAGTRAGRFMLQDLLGSFVPALKRTESWTANLIATAGCVAMWGYLLYQGVIDPLGGINTLWPLFGISNQMLAGIALMLATVVLIKMKRQRYVWVTMLPAVWLLICTVTAGFIKLFDANPAIGFLSLAKKYSDALANGQILAPAKDINQMQHVIFNAYTNATLTALFLFVVFSILFYALKVGIAAWVPKSVRIKKRHSRLCRMRNRGLHMFNDLSRLGKYLGQAARLMVGMPDYDNYVEHMQTKHPDKPVMSYEMFFRERQEARYGGKGGPKCC